MHSFLECLSNQHELLLGHGTIILYSTVLELGYCIVRTICRPDLTVKYVMYAHIQYYYGDVNPKIIIQQYQVSRHIERECACSVEYTSSWPQSNVSTVKVPKEFLECCVQLKGL